MSESATTERGPDPVVQARIRLMQHAVARLVRTIPPDASKRSRTMRMVTIDRKVRRFITQMTRRVTVNPETTIIVDDDREWGSWFRAVCDAWHGIGDAQEAGDDLTLSLLPSGLTRPREPDGPAGDCRPIVACCDASSMTR